MGMRLRYRHKKREEKPIRQTERMQTGTDRKKITQFSSTIIFHLKNEKSESIENLLDSLAIIDLLQETKVRQSVITDHNYKATYENFEESIELQISEDEYGYDRIRYEIKTTPHNTVYSR